MRNRIKISTAQLIKRSIIIIIFIAFTLSIIYPLLWMIMSSLKTNSELFLSPFKLPTNLIFNNYVVAWRAGVGRYLFNSILVTFVSGIGSVLIGLLAAFPLSRFKFKLRYVIFMMILSGLMLAPQVSLISNYKLLQALNIYNTYFALILPYITFRIPFNVFLLWSALIAIPKDIEESAWIDGCNSFTVLSRILLPLVKPTLMTGILLSAKYAWNDFVFALVFIESSKLRTIPYGLSTMQGNEYTNWTVLLAGLSISIIPIIILFLFIQKNMVRGMTIGSVKG
ncbi:MAG: carbohydrate ABC transporter permease [Pleomorphochaeta sp.]